MADQIVDLKPFGHILKELRGLGEEWIVDGPIRTADEGRCPLQALLRARTGQNRVVVTLFCDDLGLTRDQAVIFMAAADALTLMESSNLRNAILDAIGPVA